MKPMNCRSVIWKSLTKSQLPITFSDQFLWNREFALRWDLTKNLHMNFQSATHAQVDVPYPDVNTDLYADQYHAWKDSVYRSAVLNSVRTWGTPLDYSQSFTASYKVPLNLLPVFDWVNTDASYSSNYSWERGMEDENGNSYGNTINTHRELTLNGSFNLVKLYNHVPFLKKVNEKFERTQSRSQLLRKKQEKEKKKKDAKELAADPKKALPKNKKGIRERNHALA